jgi:ElaB/YqjD/DUF883 family membrane-anchored ribosome-binding protein
MQAVVETNSEKLAKDIGVLVRDGEELLKSSAHRLSDEAREKLGQAVDAAKETGLKLKRSVTKSVKVTDRSIRKHPYPFIGVALGLGVLIAFLVQRR